jgi:hypothetical protein
MSFLSFTSPLAARRRFLGHSALGLSGAAVALLAGQATLARTASAARAGDVEILNTALAAELEAVAAYQLGADSGLLQKPVLKLEQQFQGHHRPMPTCWRGRFASSAASRSRQKHSTTFPRRR